MESSADSIKAYDEIILEYRKFLDHARQLEYELVSEKEALLRRDNNATPDDESQIMDKIDRIRRGMRVFEAITCSKVEEQAGRPSSKPEVCFPWTVHAVRMSVRKPLLILDPEPKKEFELVSTVNVMPEPNGEPNPSDSSETEQARSDKMLKDVRSLLAKIPSATEEQLIEEFLALQVSGPTFSAPKRQLDQVVGLIFNKAVEEPKHCALIVTLCKKQVEMELKVNNKQSPFRNAILSRSQDTFVSKTMDDNKAALDQETDADKKKEMLARWEEDYNKFRRRKFGNINFIGQLYEQQLMPTKIIHWCLFDLLRHSHPDTNNKLPEPPYDEESIQCATQLMEAVGRSLENCRDFNGVKQYIEQIFSHFMSIAPNCSPKIKFKIYGVKELRDNQWRPRKVADKGPIKITEIHQDIQQEQQQQERDATGGADTQKKSWKTGAAGGGTSSSNIEDPGSRIFIQRQYGNPERNQRYTNTHVCDRDGVLKLARNSKSFHLDHESSSNPAAVRMAGREGKQKKIANSLGIILEELSAGDVTEDEVEDVFFGYIDNNNYGSPDLSDVYQRFMEAYVEKIRPPVRRVALKILDRCLSKLQSKRNLIDGIEKYCQWATRADIESYEDWPRIWNVLAELLANLLLITMTHKLEFELNDFSPVFVAANDDARTNYRLDLLVQTLRILAEQLAAKDPKSLEVLAMEFHGLSCRKKFLNERLSVALHICKVNIVGFRNLLEVIVKFSSC